MPRGNTSTYNFTTAPGLDVADMLTLSGAGIPSPEQDGVIQDQSIIVPAGPKPNFLWYLLGIVILLAALKYASEHEKAKMEPKIVGIGIYNYVAVGTMSMLFFIVAKTLLNKYPVRGLTQLINAS